MVSMNRTIIKIFCLISLMFSIDALSYIDIPESPTPENLPPACRFDHRGPREAYYVMCGGLVLPLPIQPIQHQQHCLTESERQLVRRERVIYFQRIQRKGILAFLCGFHQRTGAQSPIMQLPKKLIIDALKLYFKKS